MRINARSLNSTYPSSISRDIAEHDESAGLISIDVNTMTGLTKLGYWIVLS